MRTRWRVLAPGLGDRALLAVDFGPGRREAGFADLVDNLTSDHVAWQPVFVPHTDDPVDGTDPDRRIVEWLDDLRDSGLEVSGVLGYCAGAALAVRAADLARKGGLGSPTIVLFDPGRVDGTVIQDLFLESAEGYAEILPPERIRDAVADAAKITSALGADVSHQSAETLAATMHELQHLYDALVIDACRSIEAGDDVGTGFSRRFAAFLGYLMTAGRAGVHLAGAGKPTVIVSENYRMPNGLELAAHRLSVPRAALLADPAAARIVAEAIR